MTIMTIKDTKESVTFGKVWYVPEAAAKGTLPTVWDEYLKKDAEICLPGIGAMVNVPKGKRMVTQIKTYHSPTPLDEFSAENLHVPAGSVSFGWKIEFSFQEEKPN